MPSDLNNNHAEAAATEPGMTICIEDTIHNVVEIQPRGDVILDVSFENTKILRTSNRPAKVLYLTCLETMRKSSRYFSHLLGSDVFGEGLAIKATLAAIEKSNMKPSEVEPDQLPRVKIVDADFATKNMGRETVFGDMLRILHGSEHRTKPVSLLYLSTLVIMADRFACLPLITKYIGSKFASFKYPQTFDKSGEEVLRQKLLIFDHTNQAMRFASATKELILRGSSRWIDDTSEFSTAWWDLGRLEVELSHRRACILRTLAGLLSHFLAIYTSSNRKCRLGYDSSPACDSYQLGEMIKFLTKKGLLSLIPFQAVSPEDPEYVWPEPWDGDIEHLIGLLRQCPSYQIDKNHAHCGLRSKLLPRLAAIQSCIDTGVGVKLMRWKTDRAAETWIIPTPTSERGRKPFMVGSEMQEDNSRSFDFTKSRSSMELGASGLNVDRLAKALFTAQKWIWTNEGEEENLSGNTSKTLFKF